jgi:hypothetical protein
VVNQRAFGRALKPQDELMQEMKDAKFNEPELKKVFALAAIDKARSRRFDVGAGARGDRPRIRKRTAGS